jgi:hypothetical protein
MAVGMLGRVKTYNLTPVQVAELHLIAGYALWHAGRHKEALACFETAQKEPRLQHQISAMVLEECRRAIAGGK